MKSYDWVVIGGGSGGYAAARSGVALGLKTVVIDHADPLGGLCILQGCMPSKTLIESANRFRVLRDASRFGLRATGLSVNADEIVERKRALVNEFAEYRQSQLADGRFDLIRGKARFTAPHEIEVVGLDGSLQTIQAQASLVATGSVVKRLDFPGIATTNYLISDDVLEQTKLPSSIIILGGGAIALEMAHYYESLSTKVILVQRGPQLLTSSDNDLATVIKDAFEARGMEVYCGTHLLKAEQSADGRKSIRFLHEGEEKEVWADEILMATGRDPNTKGLGLEEIGVTLTSRGGVVTDNHQRSTVSHVFAAGDVCSPLEVVHLAVEQGEIASRNAAADLGKNVTGPLTIDYRLKLFGIFTEPEIATVGLSEHEAKDEGIAYRTATYPFSDHGKSMVSGSTEGFVKLMTADHSGQIIGASVIGPHAVEIIHEIVVAMHFNATAAELATIPHYHPTLSEIWTYPAEELASNGG